MIFKYLAILLTVILFSCFILTGPCIGVDLPVHNKVGFQKNVYYPVRQASLLVNFREQSEIQKIKTNQNNNDTIYIYILLIVIASGIVFFRNIDHKHKQLIALSQKEIREQTINELKIDHQLLASRAVLMGEEKERGRISRDLHDGLGGILSAVKLGLSGIRNSNSLPADMNEKLDLALNQLNASISELRSIAQNLMPEALTNFGLKDALNDFCTHLGSNNQIEISFLFYGESIRFDQSVENALFRIAQEALNNSLKHSNATKIIVQLIQDESWVNLTVQDNGQGFDLEQVRDKKSGGLKNMRARAEIFDGRFHIDSKPGEGTEIIVDLIYNNEL
jgi:two-component system, NarL family, sensor kinase